MYKLTMLQVSVNAKMLMEPILTTGTFLFDTPAKTNEMYMDDDTCPKWLQTHSSILDDLRSAQVSHYMDSS